MVKYIGKKIRTEKRITVRGQIWLNILERKSELKRE